MSAPERGVAVGWDDYMRAWVPTLQESEMSHRVFREAEAAALVDVAKAGGLRLDYPDDPVYVEMLRRALADLHAARGAS